VPVLSESMGSGGVSAPQPANASHTSGISSYVNAGFSILFNQSHVVSAASLELEIPRLLDSASQLLLELTVIELLIGGTLLLEISIIDELLDLPSALLEDNKNDELETTPLLLLESCTTELDEEIICARLEDEIACDDELEVST